MNPFKQTLARLMGDAQITYKPELIDRCAAYFERVSAANRQTNLTRITDAGEAAALHFVGAIQLLRFLKLPDGCRVIDIGAGAGFPGMPLKRARARINLTLLDASQKKTQFIRAAAESMGLDVTVLCARAEAAAHTEIRETFDVALSRAVAPLPVLAELCVPFVRVGGMFVAWKGERFAQEISDAQNAFKALGCRVKSSHRIGPGAIIVIQKQKPAPPVYPRRFAKIKSCPL